MSITVALEPQSRLPPTRKALWASGAFGVAILSQGISALALFYFTVVLGMNPAFAGFLIFVVRIYDAISDPFSGWLSDRSKSKLGRRRPFLMWGALVSGVSFALVFNTPFVETGAWMTTWVLVTMILYTTGYSLFNVPYMAMPAEITRDFHERSVLHGYRVASAALGGLAVQLLLGFLLDSLGKNRYGHSVLGYVGGVLIVVTMLVTFFGAKGLPSLPQTKVQLPLMEQLRGFLANRPFQLILGVKLAQLIGLSASTGGLVFLLVKVVDLPLKLLSVIGLATTIAVLFGTPLLLRLSRLIGKRGGYIVSALLTGLGALSWILVEPGEPIWALVLRGLVLGLAFSGNVMFAMSMLTDAMEVDYHKTGLRREGMYSALYSFIEKIATSVGPLILGGALSYAGFDPKQPPEVATPEIRQAVLLGISYVPAAMAVVAVVILAFYKLDESALKAIRNKHVDPR